MQCQLDPLIFCKDNVTRDIFELIRRGWACESVLYKIRHAKERSVAFDTVSRPKRILLLGALRAYLVERLLNCAVVAMDIQQDAAYEVPGSGHPTSDYDVNILSRRAPDLMNYILLNFYDFYDNSLLEAFDTNIYILGRFSARYARTDVPNILQVSPTAFCLRPLSMEEVQTSLAWAAVSVLDTGFESTDQRISGVLHLAATRRKACEERFKSSPNTAARIVDTYTLYYKLCLPIYAMLYEPDTEATGLIDRVCEAGYFAVEAYITPSTYNMVVLGLYVGIEVPMVPLECIAAALENYGNLVNHLKKELRELRQVQVNNKDNKDMHILLVQKYSKYVQRVYYALYRANGSFAFGEKAKVIWKEVIETRGKSPMEVDFSSLGYQQGTDINAWATMTFAQLARDIEQAWIPFMK